MRKIDRFVGQYRFLSNFFPSPIEVEGHIYPTVEHAYQAAKTLDENERATIRSCSKPGEAKRKGRRVTLRCEWEKIKEGVMLELLHLKFRNLALREELVSTESAQLIEGNGWGDTYWGVSGGKGKNRLGCLLMQVRSEVAQ